MIKQICLSVLLWMSALLAAAVPQTAVPQIDLMPNQPAPYQMRDWQQVAGQFDAFVYDFSKTGQYLPVPWWDTTGFGGNPTGFGLPSYIGSFFQTGGMAHESICTMGTVLGATLAGIDKSSQNGYNWVLMLENYFSSSQQLYLNNIGGSTGGSFWYETLPSILFYQLAWLYPGTGNFNSDFITTADRWYDACVAMGGKTSPWTLPSFDYTAFRFSDMTPVYNGIWYERDAAAAIGWVEYMAYVKTGDAKYLTAARWCMEYLLAQPSSPLYDVLLVFAPYVAQRMNVEQGTNYDIQKLINWCFSGNVHGWGVLGGDVWGGYDVSGLMSSPSYSFEMESLQLVGAVTPLPRYNQRYARAIGKYMLNAANSMRLYYSYMHDAAHQTNSDWAFTNDPQSCIGYEGLKKTRLRYAHAASDYSTGPGAIISGNYTKTWLKDTVYQVLKETPVGQYNQLEHIWLFEIDPDPATWHKLVVNGRFKKLGVDGDNGFDFYWATSPTGPWNYMFTVNSATDKDYWIDGTWAGGTGQLYIRVSDQQKNARGELDELFVNEIWIECKNESIQPYASGDPQSFGWGNTDLGLYGSGFVGILGGIVKTTNVEKILQLDLLKTDYYRSAAYPTYLYYNPYGTAQTVDVHVGSVPVDIYDTVSQEMVAVNVAGTAQVDISADTARVLVLAPAGGAVTVSGGKKFIDGVIVDYQTNTTYTTCGQIQASPLRPTGDINGDCAIDILDLADFAVQWLEQGGPSGRADINRSGQVDLTDLSILSGQWMQ